MAEKLMFLDDGERQLLIERYSDLKFVDDTDGFQCVRCNRIPIIHYFTNCGHLLCLNCKTLIDNGGFTCQQCKTLITNASEQRIEFEFQLLSLRSKCPNTKYGCLLTSNLAQIPKHIKYCEFTREAALPVLLNENDTTHVMLENLKLLREEMKAMRAEVKQLHLKNNEDQFSNAANLQKFETNTGSIKDEIDLEKNQLSGMQHVETERKNEGNSMRKFDSKEILEEMLCARQQQLSNEMQAYFKNQMEMQKKIYDEELQKLATNVNNLETQITTHRNKTSNEIGMLCNELRGIQNVQDEIKTKLKYAILKPKTLGNEYEPAAKKKISLLLIGPTNVGKSTFVNAFANYLKFKDLDHAQKSELHCLIPCAFTIHNDDDNTYNVRFGEEDENENTGARGQSATQNCKSYKIEIEELTLTIIDSPGFGDTRGEGQDTRNVNHIIDYVAPYDRLVIAVVLKPNETRLTVAFEKCMRKLISHLYLNASKEIVFIFSNSRSFLYRPGDTIIPLKEILKRLQQPLNETRLEIKFSKENVFCMDNEAFRYLVALRNDVKFNDNDCYNFKKSWQKSVEECNRMIKCISG